MTRSKSGLSRLAVCVLASVAGCKPAAPDPAVTGVTRAGVYYEATGSGTAVVLAHGFSLDRRMWEPQVDVLAEHYQVIRYDLRGHGKSVAASTPFQAYDDLGAVLDAVGVDRAAIVGLSFGAEIAVDFALQYPDRVTKLVLLSPGLSGYVPTEPFTWFQPVAEALQSGDVEEAARRWADSPLMAVSDSAAAEVIRALVADNARVWSYTRYDRSPEPPAVARVAQLKTPMLVVVGERDLPNIHGVVDTLVTCVVSARRVTIPGGRHIVNLTAPALVNQIVLDFLQDESMSPMPSEPSPCA